MSSPAQPGQPRRRATGIRRPRVAGRVPGRPTSASPADVPGALFVPKTPVDPADLDQQANVDRTLDGVAESVDGADESGVTDPPVDDGFTVDDMRAQPAGKRQQRGQRAEAHPVARRPRKPIPVPVLAAALALAVGLALFFGIADAQLRGTPAAQNTALVDIGTTAQVSQQVDDALKAIYSFDYTRLDQNEAAARAVITPGFAAQFNQLFDQVRQLAPQQQAVVTATVNLSAVKSINGDTAVLLVFLDQQATRAQSGTQPQQLAAAGRLTVTAQLVNGTWKVADVQPR
jgi:Mce-associated membrane protein